MVEVESKETSAAQMVKAEAADLPKTQSIDWTIGFEVGSLENMKPISGVFSDAR